MSPLSLAQYGKCHGRGILFSILVSVAFADPLSARLHAVDNEVQITIAPSPPLSELAAGASMPFILSVANSTDDTLCLGRAPLLRGEIGISLCSSSGLRVPASIPYRKQNVHSISPKSSYSEIIYLGKHLSPYANGEVTIEWKFDFLRENSANTSVEWANGKTKVTVLPMDMAILNKEMERLDGQFNVFEDRIAFNTAAMGDLIGIVTAMGTVRSDHYMERILQTDFGRDMFGSALVSRLSERWGSGDARDILTRALGSASSTVVQATLREFLAHKVMPPVTKLQTLMESNDVAMILLSVMFFEKIISVPPYSGLSPQDLSGLLPMDALRAMASRPDTELGARCQNVIEAVENLRGRSGLVSGESSKPSANSLIDPRKPADSGF